MSRRSIALHTLSDGYFPQRHPGQGSKEPAIDAHCKAQQCSIPLSSAHYLPILIQCPILANTTQQCPILACTLTFAGTIRRWQSKRHWALGKSECSDLPEAKINTPAPLYVQLQYPPSPPCATSILQPPLHVQLLPVGNPVHSPFLHCIGWPAKEKVKP